MTDLFGDPAMLRYAMTIEAAGMGLTALVLVALGMKYYRRAAVELEELVGPTQTGEVAHG
jgi:hypothetical protein